MSPLPTSFSAPIWSRITRLSVAEETAKASRAGMFALMSPVMMFTDGRCVATTRWMPTARAIWASRQIDSSTSRARDHHEVGELVDDDEDERHVRVLG